MANGNKVAGWYWIISAILTPLVLIATLLWAYYAQQVQTYRAEGTRLVAQIEEDHKQFDPVLNHMKSVSESTGFKMGDPLGSIDQVKGSIPNPTAFQGEERSQPKEKRSPLLNAYIDAEDRFYGTGDQPGYVHEYAAARDWLTSFERKLQRYVYLKGYQYYAVQTINIGGEGVAVASGDLSRQIELIDNVPVPPDSALEEAAARYAAAVKPEEKAADKVMQEPTRITLELIFRKQTQLIRDLVSANLHQYNLLFADVAGDVEWYELDEWGRIKYDRVLKNESGQDMKDEQNRPVYDRINGKPTPVGKINVGFTGERNSLESIKAALSGLSNKVGLRKTESIERLKEALEMADQGNVETTTGENRLQFMVVANDGRIEELQSKFANEKLTHEGDAQKYEDLVRNLPRLKIPTKLEQSDPDGEVSYSDYGRGVVHIDLGHADGVRVGQRFEVWRPHGFEKDEFVGVVEIVRMLSAHFSLCTVLTLTTANDPVRKADKIVSQLWHNGKFLKVALHGSYEPPNEAYSKERLTELLKNLGVEVVEKVQPGTDIVVLGSNLLGDEWYRRARSDLRFETLKEDDVRLYVDPR
ncbi:MAG: hypothetical protein H6840_05305 [Planctomycetes bacterium]|nr:hypothetical protein [Planctomycetota bacterium]